jgi:hypothetical protein
MSRFKSGVGSEIDSSIPAADHLRIMTGILILGPLLSLGILSPQARALFKQLFYKRKLSQFRKSAIFPERGDDFEEHRSKRRF